MLTDALVSAYHRGKWALLIRGLMGVAIGIFIFMRPLDSVAAADSRHFDVAYDAAARQYEKK